MDLGWDCPKSKQKANFLDYSKGIKLEYLLKKYFKFLMFKSTKLFVIDI